MTIFVVNLIHYILYNQGQCTEKADRDKRDYIGFIRSRWWLIPSVAIRNRFTKRQIFHYIIYIHELTKFQTSTDSEIKV